MVLFEFDKLQGLLSFVSDRIWVGTTKPREIHFMLDAAYYTLEYERQGDGKGNGI